MSSKLHGGVVAPFGKVVVVGGLLESFGNGECACIAVALYRRYTLAIDDKKAIKQARLSCPTISIINTQDLMVSMIKSGLITVNEADAIKDEWASTHKFKLKIHSFGDLL